MICINQGKRKERRGKDERTNLEKAEEGSKVENQLDKEEKCEKEKESGGRKMREREDLPSGINKTAVTYRDLKPKEVP